MSETIWLRFVLLSALGGLVGPAVFGAEKVQTKIRDGSDRMVQELLGEHRLRLQWIDFEDKTKDTGQALVESRDGLLHVKGEQRDAKENFLAVDGDILEVTPISFRMKGKIISRVTHLNAGAPCERSGEFTFAVYGGRPYWRLQQLQSPCASHVDYIDLLFRPKPKKISAADGKKVQSSRSRKKK